MALFVSNASEVLAVAKDDFFEVGEQPDLSQSEEEVDILSRYKRITVTADLTLVTRNTKDFENIHGLSVVTPWHANTTH